MFLAETLYNRTLKNVLDQWDDVLAVVAAVRRYLELTLRLCEKLKYQVFCDSMLCNRSSSFVRSSESKQSWIGSSNIQSSTMDLEDTSTSLVQLSEWRILGLS